jgi:hypothetical protein
MLPQKHSESTGTISPLQHPWTPIVNGIPLQQPWPFSSGTPPQRTSTHWQLSGETPSSSATKIEMTIASCRFSVSMQRVPLGHVPPQTGEPLSPQETGSQVADAHSVESPW